MMKWILLFCCLLGAGILSASEAELATLRNQAELGDAQAQLALGTAYEQGQGVARDLEQALRWYQRAAEQGLAEAQYQLAYLLAEAEISPVAAAEWMAKAADQGMVEAQYLMGMIHAEGIGVAQDTRQARRWLEKAIAAGHAEAEDYLNNHMPGR
ncbi:MAG: tetratricopeptide repeat protein [Thiohalomonadaceae bacterium]